MRIIHLSDMHYSGTSIENKRFFKLVEDLKSENNKKPIDIIFITGDLINKGGKDFNSLSEAFSKFKEERLDVIIKQLDFNKENIIFCIGNHDINRMNVDEFTEEGLRSKLISKEYVNKFMLERYKEADNCISRINDYKNFEAQYSQGNKNCCITNFESNYCLDVDGHKVGISAFNSCWRCSGKDDYKFLILGKEQINKSVEYLSSNNCDIKIALMHHSYEFLQDFEQRDIKNEICNNYDYLFLGHVHTNDSYLNMGLLNNIFVSVAQSNSINYSKDDSLLYSLGYSIIDLDFKLKKIVAWGRRYSETRKDYVKNVDMYGDCGFKEYPMISDMKREKKEKIYNTLKVIQENYIDGYDEHLLSYRTDSKAPKTINEIFVVPTIVGEKKETLEHSEYKEKEYSIEELCHLTENTMLFGCKESGKTILLDKMMIEFVEKYEAYGKIPIRIDLNEIKVSRIETVVKRYLSIQKSELKEILNSGDVVLLIDNFSLEINYNKHRKMISDFKKEYSNVRLVFAINTKMQREIPIEIAKDEFFNNFMALYILAWKSGEISNIINMWFQEEQHCVTVKEIINIFDEIKMTITPLNISMFLWIIEHQNNYKLINKGKLMECFFEHLLEKLMTDDSYSDTFDHTNKIRLLSAIAYKMYENAETRYKIEKVKLFEYTKEYLKRRKFNVDYIKIIEYFINKGVLIEEIIGQEHYIVFRFECFYRFFISQYMIYNKKFSEFVFEECNYLQFQDEIEYYTGIKRDEIDYLKNISNIMEGRFKTIEKIVLANYKKIDSYYESEKSLCDEIEAKDIDIMANHKQTIDISKIEICENDKKIESITNEVAIGTVKENKQMCEIDILFDTWTLVAKMLKNTEEIDDEEIKNDIYRKIIYSSILFFIIYKAMVDKVIEDELNKNPEALEYQIMNDMKVTSKMIPLINSEVVNSLLSTSKLEIVVSEEIEKSLNNFNEVENELDIYISLFLLIDINKNKGMEYLEKFIKIYRKPYLKDLIFFKILYEYFLTSNAEMEKKYTDILYKLKYSDTNDRHIQNRTIYKTQILNNLESKKNEYRKMYSDEF